MNEEVSVLNISTPNLLPNIVLPYSNDTGSITGYIGSRIQLEADMVLSLSLSADYIITAICVSIMLTGLSLISNSVRFCNTA